MISSFFAELGSLASAHVSLLIMLLKATIILIVALGVTLSMQRASAGARHLVWLVTLAMLLLLVPALSTWAPLPLRTLPATRSALIAPSAASSVARHGSAGSMAVGGLIAGGLCALIGICVSFALGDVTALILVMGTLSSAVAGAIGGWLGRFVFGGARTTA